VTIGSGALRNEQRVNSHRVPVGNGVSSQLEALPPGAECSRRIQYTDARVGPKGPSRLNLEPMRKLLRGSRNRNTTAFNAMWLIAARKQRRTLQPPQERLPTKTVPAPRYAPLEDTQKVHTIRSLLSINNRFHMEVLLAISA
jgi:hypothetical protein